MSTGKHRNTAEVAQVSGPVRLSDASRMAAQQVHPDDEIERNKLRAIHQILVKHDSLPESEQAGFLEAVLHISEEALSKQLKAESKERTQSYLKEELEREYEEDLKEYQAKSDDVIRRIYDSDITGHRDTEDPDFY